MSYALAYKCHADFDEPQVLDTKKTQNEKNLIEGNQLLLDDGTEKKDIETNTDEKEDEAKGKPHQCRVPHIMGLNNWWS